MGVGGRIVVVGLGYVGLPLALRAVEVGYDVIGYDLDERRIVDLMSGVSYVDDVSNAQLKWAVETGRFRATDEISTISGFDIAIIAVPTPLRDGVPDLTYVESAARAVGELLAPGGCVVLESTTYPGTTEQVLVPLLERASGLSAGTDFHAGFSPERIDPGNPTWTLVTTPKSFPGINPASLAVIKAFYADIVDTVVEVREPKQAELAKLLENTFRHVNIALVNELAIYARGLGIDFWEVIDAASTKPFGFMPFRPGPGVGGHCLPIDPSYLSWRVRRELGSSVRFIELANEINDQMPEHVTRRIGLALNRRGRSVQGSRLLLLGLSYKRNSGDSRESPAIRIAQQLAVLGADLRLADPLVEHLAPIDGERVEATVEELLAADLVVILSDHDAFDWDAVAIHSTHIFDTRRRLEGPNVEHL